MREVLSCGILSGVVVLHLLLGGCGAELPVAPVADPVEMPVEGPAPEEPAVAEHQLGAVGHDLILEWQAVVDLSNRMGLRLDWDPFHRRLDLGEGDEYLRLRAGIAVLERSGTFLPLVAAPSLDDQGNPRVPLLGLAMGLDLVLTLMPRPGGGFEVSAELPERVLWPQRHEPPADAAALAGALEFLSSPIAGAGTDLPDSHLPGAPRDYRNGTHQGFDWYQWAAGVPINRETPVLSMAGGTVVRADHSWTTPSLEQMNQWTRLSAGPHGTPDWVLDLLYGRQIWVDHGGGVLVKYAHLDGIASALQPGNAVTSGQMLGYVGNSGTMSEVRGADSGLHLHADVLLWGRNVWLELDYGDIRWVLGQIFGGGD